MKGEKMALRKTHNPLKLLWRWLVSATDEAIPDETKLEQDVREMMAGMENLSEHTAYVMAQAAQKKRELEAEVRNHDALKAQAKAFLTNGQRPEAERLVALKMASAARIENLTAQLEQQRNEAQALILRYQKEDREVKARAAKLPQLQADAKFLRQQQQSQKALSEWSLKSPTAAFDERAKEIALKRDQGTMQRQLENGKDALLDASIALQLEATNLDQEMLLLERELGQVKDPKVEEAEFEVDESKDKVANARKLLSEPNFQI
ncbi:MAG: hypothetical protein ABH884_00415 [Candidatus Komeilibacteria bacterium]